MGLTAVVIFLVALAAPSFQQSSWDQTSSSGTGWNGNSYTDGLLGNLNQGSCYDRCYDAYRINPNDYHARGCVCSNFDFPVSGGFGDAFNNIRNIHRAGYLGQVARILTMGILLHAIVDTNLEDCPLGTICRREFGRRTCVPRSDIGGGQWSDGAFPGNRRCGYLSPSCRAAPGDYNAVYRYTYDHTRQACVKLLIHASCCSNHGASNNVFSSQFQCSTQCEYNNGYY